MFLGMQVSSISNRPFGDIFENETFYMSLKDARHSTCLHVILDIERRHMSPADFKIGLINYSI